MKAGGTSGVTEVMTVLGPLAAQDLGIVLPHEHLLLDLARVSRDPDHVINDRDLAVIEAGAFRDAGGRTIVDVTNRGLGRDPHALVEISRATGLNIVMGCGWYREPFYAPRLVRTTVDSLADEMVSDLVDGVDGSGIRAGIIGEIGCDREWISPVEERMYRAAARAHKRTGIAIGTHSVWWAGGIAQLDLLADEGVDPRRVIIGHCDTYPFPEYHDAVARRGAFVEFDTVGRGHFEWDIQRRIEWVVRLVRAGHLQQILLSQDVCKKSHLKAYGGTGYDYVAAVFSGRLVEAGLDPGEVRTIMVDNPRRALTGS